ncbi:probably inactive leucine-rich repeat receptor-like protein kinase At3g28040 isoform X1 [Cannabis sativa]|uniref:Protein kinase domain-containing protein n=1 Tax=Cannabis sativa TaxID=3483 RepID=A0A803R7N4_CANSA|nr:probably inactive leucine-rich repeat receptor-like protein kinase At3g28040 isoform X1 [Cannabis sativa]
MMTKFPRLVFSFLACFISSILIQNINGNNNNNNKIGVQLNDDVLGLIVFKSDVQDPSSHLSSWNEDDDSPCSWKFVHCNPKTGRVSELSLDGLGLSGKVGRGLEKLQFLKVLSLSGNNLSGDISSKFSLPYDSLQVLNLSRNKLSGRIPASFLDMKSIRVIDISQNSISGPLPDNMFGPCLSLHHLSLAENLLEGPIPQTLFKCLSLNTLNISTNRFSGNPEFVSGFWLLRRIRTLDLSKNFFSGSLPQGISALHYLKQFSVQENHFSGSLPSDIGLCPHLTRIDLSNNQLSGALPESFRRLNLLTLLNLADNMVSGDFPQWIGELRNLESLDLSNNEFTGSLPSSIGEMNSLNFLSLSNNKLIGTIPTTIGGMTKLLVINLKGNNFNGSIPEGLFNLALEEVDFSENQLTGPIPTGSTSSTRVFESLHFLDLSMNNIQGTIPAEMGLFSRLEYLNLSWNNLESRIPPELGLFRNLTVLDLRSSGLLGSIPEDICDSGSLDILQLDGNSLSGQIPNEIGNCSSLSLLSLSHNNISGPIPMSITEIKKLKMLNLEFNQLSGEIPMELGKLPYLLAVNVSYNRLIGRLPVGGIFQSLDQSSLEGNLGICSPLLKGPCKMNVSKPLVLDPNAYDNQIGGGEHQKQNPSEPSQIISNSNNSHMFLSVSAIIAISAASLILVGVIVISLLNVSARKRLAFVEEALESMCSSSSRSGASLAVGKLVLFDSRLSEEIGDLVSLLNKASEIGEGVFGTVYKVALCDHQERTELAIKKLVTSNIIQYPEDFDREVRNLGKAKHPNLVSLKGYYWTPQVQLLVTEYASNGSLQSKLHERISSVEPLTWPQRFKILVGTAKGLAHLHHSITPPIVHYNLKPSNILLDQNMNPKISDFGLARLLTKLDKHVISNRFQSALGYVAPELACRSLRVNEKCDVYGFGVLILELVTGRRPVEYGEDNVVILSDHARVLLEEGNVLDCVDASIGHYPEDEVLPVLKLALVCTSQVPSSRPSMAEVVQILQVIKTPVPQRMEMF